jgi:hypothetical protein
MALIMPSEMEIWMAATFIVASGSEPRKLISIPIKKIFTNDRM